MFEFHADRKRYFDIQVQNAEEHVIPFIQQVQSVKKGMRVLEIGCGEAGVLKPFLELGCEAVGVEFDVIRFNLPKELLSNYLVTGQLKLIGKDIFKVDVEKELGRKFDIIILKDVIEHIHNQPKLIADLKQFLQPNGCIFFGFPPWQMPFGGHQQLNKNKFLSALPYYHLLPKKMYKWLIKLGNGPVEELLEIRDTKISIEDFERIANDCGYNIINKKHYLINPIYQYKFGLKARTQFSIISKIPWFRNFVTTCVYYLIQPK
jgi:SAM-dependent methyltransferase